MAVNMCLTLFAANCYCDVIACEFVYLFTVMCSFVLGLFLVVDGVERSRSIRLVTYPSIHPFILYQTTKVHRLGIHIKRYKHTAYTQTDKDRHTPNNTDY